MPLSGRVVRRPDGLIVWQASTGAALGPVTFDAYGIGIAVDAADPAAVVTVIAAADNRDSGATCFVDPDFLTNMIDATAGSELPGPVLVDDVVRAATIHAVGKFHLGALDEAIVALDTAHAAALAGDQELAQAHYLMASATMDSLLDRLTDGEGGEAIAEELEQMIARCPEMDPDQSVARVAAAVIDRHNDSLTNFLSAEQHRAAAVHGGATGGNTGERLDLSLLPPRVIRFTGPDQNDLSIRELSDDTIEVSAILRDELDSDSSEVEGLSVLAVDSLTGELIASAPCEASEGLITARLWLADNPLGDTHFVLVAADVPLGSVHADRFAVQIARLDRQCRHSWSQHRRASAVIELVSTATRPESVDVAETWQRFLTADAVDWVTRTEREIADLVDQNEDDPTAQRILADYGHGVRRLHEVVTQPVSPGGPRRPTLAELCAEAGW